MIFVMSAFTLPRKLPEKAYSVRIIAAPQPKIIEPEIKEEPKLEPEPKPEPEPVPQIQAQPEPSEQKRKQPKKEPTPKPAQVKPKETSPIGTGHITIDGPQLANDYYLNLIYMKVYRNWIPPSTSARLSATIYFWITRDGEVRNAKVEKRSGNNAFDEQALRTILASSPFPELPAEYSRDHLAVHFEFVHNE